MKQLIGFRGFTAINLLKYNRSSAVAAVMSVVSVVILVGFQLSVFFGLIENITGWLRQSKVDFVIAPKNTLNVLNSWLIPVDYHDRILGLSQVEWVKPLVQDLTIYRDEKGRPSLVQLIGVQRPDLRGGPWRFVNGEGALHDLLDYKGITLDQVNHLMLGNPPLDSFANIGEQKVLFKGLSKNIRGLQGARIYTNIELANQILNINPLFSNLLLVKIKDDYKGNISAIKTSLDKMLPQTTVYTKEEAETLMALDTLMNTGSGITLLSSVGISLIIGFIIISLTFYNNILKYTDDITIIHVLGGRKRDIWHIVVTQTLVISTLGITLGFILLSVALLFSSNSTLGVAYPSWFLPIQIVSTYVLCFAGAWFSLNKALKIDPTSVFR